MVRFITRRVLVGVATIIAISIIVFGLFFAVPSSPAKVMCGKNCDPASIAAVETRLGLREPIVEQYTSFMKGVFVGRTYAPGTAFERQCDAPCLGYSFRNDEPVTAILKRTVPVTISIVVGAAILWLLIGVSLGMISALRRGTLFDKIAIGISLTGASMQVFFFGLILLYGLVYATGWLDFPSYTPFTENPLKWAQGLILPWVTLGFLNSAIYARLSRAQMLETLSEDYVRTARAKGLPLGRVYTKHALRAAITPIVTIAGLDIGASLGGTFITETIFGLRGLGKETVEAVNFLNLPIVVATVLLAAVFIVVANLIVDLLYAVIDPRVRLS
ncbi:peptide/nickel transport system permease protein [Asanoa hainanensis]|uniref:Peptide/nickel transport system permease protein n=1 Tax=Asanoa hainanensis TaxID=560556 RepID=A0A239I2U0_9ACTN|nr:ABC transporter permease [Asanoa hainanensis]SNS87915.1 peptide/nickel transport system permease protein [Asanoa hainanensis]